MLDHTHNVINNNLTVSGYLNTTHSFHNYIHIDRVGKKTMFLYQTGNGEIQLVDENQDPKVFHNIYTPSGDYNVRRNLTVSCNISTSTINGFDVGGALNQYKYHEKQFIPVVRENGTVEIGKYIDFHDYNGNPPYQDYTMRIESVSNKLLVYGIDSSSNKKNNILTNFGDIYCYEYDNSSNAERRTVISGKDGGASSLPGDLTVNGNIYAKKFSIQQSLVNEKPYIWIGFNGQGIMSMNTYNELNQFYKPWVFNESLTVNGIARFNSDITVNGQINAKNIYTKTECDISYAPINHNHDSIYSIKTHTHNILSSYSGATLTADPSTLRYWNPGLLNNSYLYFQMGQGHDNPGGAFWFTYKYPGQMSMRFYPNGNISLDMDNAQKSIGFTGTCKFNNDITVSGITTVNNNLILKRNLQFGNISLKDGDGRLNINKGIELLDELIDNTKIVLGNAKSSKQSMVMTYINKEIPEFELGFWNNGGSDIILNTNKELTVNDATTIVGNLNVSGATTLKDINVKGTMNIDKDIYMNGSANSSVGPNIFMGDVEIRTALDTCNIYVKDNKIFNLTSSAARINGSLTVENNLAVLNNAEFSKPIKVWNGINIHDKTVSNDYARIYFTGQSNAGSLEIATADDASEPIHIRQYTGNFATLKRTLTLLDGNGNTSIPGNLTVSNATTVSGQLTVNGRITTHDTVDMMDSYVIAGDTNTRYLYFRPDGGTKKNLLLYVTSGGALNIRDENHDPAKFITLYYGSQTVTHRTDLIGEIGTFCETTGELYNGYERITHVDCICGVKQATTLNPRIVGIICSEDEFASHGDVLVKVVPGEYELGDILCPDENGFGRKATEEEEIYMMRKAIPRPKITCLNVEGFDGFVAAFIV